MTWAFLETMKQSPNPSYAEVCFPAERTPEDGT